VERFEEANRSGGRDGRGLCDQIENRIIEGAAARHPSGERPGWTSARSRSTLHLQRAARAAAVERSRASMSATHPKNLDEVCALPQLASTTRMATARCGSRRRLDAVCTNRPDLPEPLVLMQRRSGFVASVLRPRRRLLGGLAL